MSSENRVTLIGNLTDDPELRFTSGGAAVVNFTVAVNRRKKNGDQWEDVLDGFFKCSCWRDMAENVAESLVKGQRVIVAGSLEQRHWEAQDGSKRSAIEVRVDEVGPSLRWATGRVEKSNRSSSGGSGGGGGGGDWGAPVTAPPAGGSEEGSF